jgi:hypothetical protein
MIWMLAMTDLPTRFVIRDDMDLCKMTVYPATLPAVAFVTRAVRLEVLCAWLRRTRIVFEPGYSFCHKAHSKRNRTIFNGCRCLRPESRLHCKTVRYAFKYYVLRQLCTNFANGVPQHLVVSQIPGEFKSVRMITFRDFQIVYRDVISQCSGLVDIVITIEYYHLLHMDVDSERIPRFNKKKLASANNLRGGSWGLHLGDLVNQLPTTLQRLKFGVAVEKEAWTVAAERIDEHPVGNLKQALLKITADSGMQMNAKVWVEEMNNNEGGKSKMHWVECTRVHDQGLDMELPV